MSNNSLINTSGTGWRSKLAGTEHTSREIAQQPLLWIETYRSLTEQESSLKRFLEKVTTKPNLQVILSGAGTSAYIGDILEGPFQRNTGLSTRAIATTDLVSHPEAYFQKQKPTLLISFARSGNSPESIAAIDLANSFCDEIYHLKITCNKDGEMVKVKNDETSLVFFLPQEANDQSLAMTSSFTCMSLAGLLISQIGAIEKLKIQVDTLAQYGNTILEGYLRSLENVASLDFKRAVFLGSGPSLGSARESHLKLLELSDGKVICNHDSFLGFRHGPKAVIDQSTLIVYLFSNNPYVSQYECDLVKDINKGEKGMFSIGIFETEVEFQKHPVYRLIDLPIILSKSEHNLKEEFLPVAHVLVAQILGFYKALNLGLKPDAPSINNMITRVVQGVNIYPFIRADNDFEKRSVF